MHNLSCVMHEFWIFGNAFPVLLGILNLRRSRPCLAMFSVIGGGRMPQLPQKVDE